MSQRQSFNLSNPLFAQFINEGNNLPPQTCYENQVSHHIKHLAQYLTLRALINDDYCSWGKSNIKESISKSEWKWKWSLEGLTNRVAGENFQQLTYLSDFHMDKNKLFHSVSQSGQFICHIFALFIYSLKFALPIVLKIKFHQIILILWPSVKKQHIIFL